jgi:glutathione synthase
MAIKIGVIMDDINHIKPHKDTSFALMLAAQALKCNIFYMQQHDISIKKDNIYANMQQIKVQDTQKDYYTIEEENSFNLNELDYIFMRKDPPVDENYIFTTQILDMVEQQGVKVCNKPQSLRNFNEKLYATLFPELIPDFIVSRNKEDLKEFLHIHQEVIFKPLDGMGGKGIFKLYKDDVNFAVIWESLTEHGQKPIMAQVFIPDITKGDKRVLVLNGKVIDYTLARLPQKGSIRGNLAAGGSYEVMPITKRERDIAETVAPHLVKNGISLAGLDIIGNYLTEINITSPTCMREISKFLQKDLAKDYLEGLFYATT